MSDLHDKLRRNTEMIASYRHSEAALIKENEGIIAALEADVAAARRTAQAGA